MRSITNLMKIGMVCLAMPLMGAENTISTKENKWHVVDYYGLWFPVQRDGIMLPTDQIVVTATKGDHALDVRISAFNVGEVRKEDRKALLMYAPISLHYLHTFYRANDNISLFCGAGTGPMLYVDERENLDGKPNGRELARAFRMKGTALLGAEFSAFNHTLWLRPQLSMDVVKSYQEESPGWTTLPGVSVMIGLSLPY